VETAKMSRPTSLALVCLVLLLVSHASPVIVVAAARPMRLLLVPALAAPTPVDCACVGKGCRGPSTMVKGKEGPTQLVANQDDCDRRRRTQ
jgi:hypothetical protein